IPRWRASRAPTLSPTETGDASPRRARVRPAPAWRDRSTTRSVVPFQSTPALHGLPRPRRPPRSRGCVRAVRECRRARGCDRRPKRCEGNSFSAKLRFAAHGEKREVRAQLGAARLAAAPGHATTRELGALLHAEQAETAADRGART